VGVLLVDRAHLRLQVGSADAFPEDLPPVLQDTVARLDRIVEESVDAAQKERATRALSHLYKLLQRQDELLGGAAR
jgi:hypothetical protein